MVCIAAAEYLVDSCDQDGFSDVDSNSSCLSVGIDDVDDFLGQWQDDEPQQKDIAYNTDDDVWHARGSGLNLDIPDEPFQEEDETPCEESLLAPLAKKPRHEELLTPTFMGDAGFDAPHLDAWRQAEARVGIINAAAKVPMCKKAAAPILPPMLMHAPPPR